MIKDKVCNSEEEEYLKLEGNVWLHTKICMAQHIKCPTTLKSIGKKFFDKPNEATIWNPCCEIFDFNEGLEEIEESAFYGSKIRKAKFPKSLKKVGKHAFANCRYLCDVVCNEGLESMGEGAFYDYRPAWDNKERYVRKICYPSTLQNVGQPIIDSQFVEHIGLVKPDKIVNYDETAKLFKGYNWPRLKTITLWFDNDDGTWFPVSYRIKGREVDEELEQLAEIDLKDEEDIFKEIMKLFKVQER